MQSARILLAVVCLWAGGCWHRSGPEVVVYAALDRPFSEPVLDQFTSDTGVRVLASYDGESTKTVGLTSRIMAERARPRCDLFWNNEILNTLRLQQQGLLDVYTSPQAQHYPREFVSPDGHWHGFAARVRVLIVNTDKLPRDQWPTSIRDLIDPKYKGQVGIAKPLFGTTATHAACLFDAWGDEGAEEFFLRLKGNAKVLSGNKQVAQAVARGELLFGLTDTDDAYMEKSTLGCAGRNHLPRSGRQSDGCAVHSQHVGDHQRRSPPPASAEARGLSALRQRRRSTRR